MSVAPCLDHLSLLLEMYPRHLLVFEMLLDPAVNLGSMTPATLMWRLCVFIGGRQRKGKFLLSIIN